MSADPMAAAMAAMATRRPGDGGEGGGGEGEGGDVDGGGTGRNVPCAWRTLSRVTCCGRWTVAISFTANVSATGPTARCRPRCGLYCQALSEGKWAASGCALVDAFLYQQNA